MKKLAKSKPAPKQSETELRRWCIETAIRWPSENYGGAVYSVGGGGPRVEADIIGRAKRIREWVTSNG